VSYRLWPVDLTSGYRRAGQGAGRDCGTTGGQRDRPYSADARIASGGCQFCNSKPWRIENYIIFGHRPAHLFQCCAARRSSNCRGTEACKYRRGPRTIIHRQHRRVECLDPEMRPSVAAGLPRVCSPQSRRSPSNIDVRYEIISDRLRLSLYPLGKFENNSDECPCEGPGFEGLF